MVKKEQQIEDEEFSLKEVILKLTSALKYLMSKWVIILTASILGGLIGLTYAYIKKPTYKATLDFVLEDGKSGGGLSGALGLASQFGFDLNSGGSNGAFSGDNILELMKSRLMVEKALLTTLNISGKRTTLADFYIDFNQIRDSWKNKPEQNVHFLPNSDRSKFSLKQDSVLGVFYKDLIKKNLIVDKIDKKLSIISLSVNSTNELFSKNFAEVLTKVVSDFYIQTRTRKALKNVSILQRQTDSVRYVLNLAISEVAYSTDAAPNANPLLQKLRVPAQRKQIDVAANTAILGELVKQLEIAKMSLLQETPLIEIIDKPILPLEKDKASKIKAVILMCGIGAIIATAFLLIKKFLQECKVKTFIN